MKIIILLLTSMSTLLILSIAFVILVVKILNDILETVIKGEENDQ